MPLRRSGIAVEFVPARAGDHSKNGQRGQNRARSILICTSAAPNRGDGLLPENILEPVEPFLILPDVKDPKQWWGGHIYIDNASVSSTTSWLPDGQSLANPTNIGSRI